MALLFVGLGNPGKEFETTRHNFGFMVLDYLAEKLNLNFEPKFKGLLAKYKDSYFLKPLTYMNNSGESVKEAIRNLKISLDNLIVIHDDLDLKLGVIKIKKGGSNAGHHGLDSISNLVGNDYWRIRLGIGRPAKREEVINYVLSSFLPQEKKLVDKVVETTAKKILDILENGEVKNERILL